jgi:uncharacterized protein YpmS
LEASRISNGTLKFTEWHEITLTSEMLQVIETSKADYITTNVPWQFEMRQERVIVEKSYRYLIRELQVCMQLNSTDYEFAKLWPCVA